MKNEAAATLRPQIIRRLQQAILDSGLTYHQIAEKEGVSTFVISTYMMREPKMPTLETLAVLLPVLGVSADWVVLGLRMSQINESWPPCHRCAPRCMECKSCMTGTRCGGCENKSNFEQHGEPRWRFCPDCGRPQTEEEEK